MQSTFGSIGSQNALSPCLRVAMSDDNAASAMPWWGTTRWESRWKGKGEGKGKSKSKSKKKGGKVQGWVISEDVFATFFGDHGSGATSSKDAQPQVNRVKDEVKQEATPGKPDGLEPDDAKGGDETMAGDTAREDAPVGTSDVSRCIPPPIGDPRRSDFVLHVKQWMSYTFTDAEMETLMT